VTHSNAIKFQAVIFDLFGTLVEDFMFSIGANNINLAEILGVPDEPFRQMWRQTSEMRVNGHFQTVEASIVHVCDAIGAKVGPKQLSEAVQSRLQQIKGGLKPKSDAIETLTRLKRIDCKLGLLSNCSIEIPVLWPETEFADLFDSAVFSSKDCLRKPDSAIFRLACERLGVAPEACLYVADGENFELAAAAQVGLHPVLIRNQLSHRRPKLFREAEKWRGDVVSALSEVLMLARAHVDT
jgi:putative hydrolase of the HAD superfamily